MHHLFAKAFFFFVSTTGTVGAGLGAWKLASKTEVLDIANNYAFAKYSNGYLGFGDKANEDYALRSRRTQEMHLALSGDSNSLTFTKDRNDLWRKLVLFCRGVNETLMSGKNLNLEEVKNIGGCNSMSDGYIPVNYEMSSRDYGADLFIKAKYKATDFEFGGKLGEQRGEKTAKLHDLIKEKGYYSEDLLPNAKVRCDAFRNKFNADSKDKFVERDLEVIPLCRSSIEKR